MSVCCDKFIGYVFTVAVLLYIFLPPERFLNMVFVTFDSVAATLIQIRRFLSAVFCGVL